MTPIQCKCGCGNYLKQLPNNRTRQYIVGHNNRGKRNIISPNYKRLKDNYEYITTTIKSVHSRMLSLDINIAANVKIY